MLSFILLATCLRDQNQKYWILTSTKEPYLSPTKLPFDVATGQQSQWTSSGHSPPRSDGMLPCLTLALRMLLAALLASEHAGMFKHRAET